VPVAAVGLTVAVSVTGDPLAKLLPLLVSVVVVAVGDVRTGETVPLPHPESMAAAPSRRVVRIGERPGIFTELENSKKGPSSKATTGKAS
jgi:hypothetical protein